MSEIPAGEIAEAADSTPDLGDAGALRQRMGVDGYLLLRGVLPVGVVAEVRDELARVLIETGVAVAGAEEGAFGAIAPASPGRAVDVHGDAGLFRKLYSREALHRLPHHVAVLRVAQSLLDTDSVLVHPRPALRVVFPATDSSDGATPPHQDHLGMQGTESTYTFWMPLGRCAVGGGVLAVAPRSQNAGLRPYLPLPAARVAGCDSADLEGTWVAADLDPGDLLVFHSLTVHRALPNRSGQIRLSLDARYQAASAPVCAASLGDPPHMTWDEVYARWSAEGEDLKRHWEKVATNVVAFDAGRLAP